MSNLSNIFLWLKRPRDCVAHFQLILGKELSVQKFYCFVSQNGASWRNKRCDSFDATVPIDRISPKKCSTCLINLNVFLSENGEPIARN